MFKNAAIGSTVEVTGKQCNNTKGPANNLKILEVTGKQSDNSRSDGQII